VLVDGDAEAVLEREPLVDGRYHDRFVAVHDRLDRYEVRFDRAADGRVVAATHGPRRFERDGHDVPSAGGGPRPEEGTYRSNDPWESVLRVYQRGGRLFLWSPSAEEEWQLSEVGDGLFAAGDPALPRRLRFHGDADGRVLVVELNGGRWYRSNED